MFISVLYLIIVGFLWIHPILALSAISAMLDQTTRPRSEPASFQGPKILKTRRIKLYSVPCRSGFREFGVVEKSFSSLLPNQVLDFLQAYSVDSGVRSHIRESTKALFYEVFFAIFTTPFAFERRQAVRTGLFRDDCFSSEQPDAAGKFFIGMPSIRDIMTEEGRDSVQKLMSEMDLYNDIILIRKEDCYRGSGFKHRYIFEYVNSPFPIAKYLMKADDDVYIKSEFILSYVKNLELENYYYLGHIMYGQKPFRDIHDKYYLSEEEYSAESFPPFASGTGFILSIEITKDLLLQDMHFYSMEDISVGVWINNLIENKSTEKPIVLRSLPEWHPFGLPATVQDPNLVHSLSPSAMTCFYTLNRLGIYEKNICANL